MWTERRWLMPVVGVSLLLNVFLVGILAGRSYGFGHPGARPHAEPTAVVPAGHIKALPKDERKQFNMTMAMHREGIRAAREEQRRLRRQTEEDIASPTFDRDKVAADFKALRENGLLVQEKVQAGLVDALEGLSPASRAALVAREDTGSAAPPDHR